MLPADWALKNIFSYCALRLAGSTFTVLTAGTDPAVFRSLTLTTPRHCALSEAVVLFVVIDDDDDIVGGGGGGGGGLLLFLLFFVNPPPPPPTRSASRH